MIETLGNVQMSVDEVQKNKPDEIHDSENNADLSRMEINTSRMIIQQDNPPTSQMVLSALTTLKRKKGISYQAIKKFISATYKKDVKKLTPYVKRFLKSAVSCGILHQVTGKGARGSFKLVKRQHISTSYRKVSSNPSCDKVLIRHISGNFHRNEDKKVPRLIRKSKNSSSRIASYSDNSLHKSTSTSQLFIGQNSSLDLTTQRSDKNVSVSTSTDSFMHQTSSVPSTRSLDDMNRRSSRNITTSRIESSGHPSQSATTEPSSIIVDSSSVEEPLKNL